MTKNEIKEYFNEKEWKIIDAIITNVYGYDKLRPFFLQCKYNEQSKKSLDEYIASSLKVEKEKLMKFMALFYWHESPLHSAFKDFNTKRKIAFILSEMKEWKETPEQIVEFGVLFTRLMNPLIFRNIIKNLEICDEMLEKEPGDDMKKALEGREKLMTFSEKVMDSIGNYFSENAEKGTYSFQTAMVREDRFTLPERFLVSIGDIFGINENPLLNLRNNDSTTK